jgi:hypothetical protein
VRVVREVETRLLVGRVTAGIDLERTDLPVGGNRLDQEEHQDQGAEEQDESKPPAAATVVITRGHRDRR